MAASQSASAKSARPLAPLRDQDLAPDRRSVDPSEQGEAEEEHGQCVMPERLPTHAPPRPKPDSHRDQWQKAYAVNRPCPVRTVYEEKGPQQVGCVESGKLVGDPLGDLPHERDYPERSPHQQRAEQREPDQV